ncbi:MAG: two-component system response regulator, partial [Bacteroidales bacterium]|nr:two-component system response regulator [Bacteroidales bacterium]
KQGKALQYNPKEVFEITKPLEARLPKSHLSSTYIFSTNQDFFAYPNKYNYYAKYYKDTFQHGGISLEEMIIPFVTLQAI